VVARIFTGPITITHFLIILGRLLGFSSRPPSRCPARSSQGTCSRRQGRGLRPSDASLDRPRRPSVGTVVRRRSRPRPIRRPKKHVGRSRGPFRQVRPGPHCKARLFKVYHDVCQDLSRPLVALIPQPSPSRGGAELHAPSRSRRDRGPSTSSRKPQRSGARWSRRDGPGPAGPFPRLPTIRFPTGTPPADLSGDGQGTRLLSARLPELGIRPCFTGLSVSTGIDYITALLQGYENTTRRRASRFPAPGASYNKIFPRPRPSA